MRRSSLYPAVAVSSGLLGGIAAAVIVIVVALIVGFVVYKRQTDKKQRKLIDDYASQLQMVRAHTSPREPTHARTQRTLTT